MKPTSQQIKVLQDYLHQTLTYREAYDEIYDHILSALEQHPDDVTFEEAVNQVINNDFGGPKNLVKAEKGIKDTLVKDSIQRYIGYLLAYFKFPAVLATALGILLIYYLLAPVTFNFKVIIGLLSLISLTPGIIWMLRLYNTGYILDTTRRSSKDKLFETLAGIPIRVSLAVIFINTVVYKIDSWEDKRYLITAVLSAGILYSLALFKLYKEEFKSKAIR
jgi:hypothetical protein